MSVQTLRKALDTQAANDITVEFRQILAGLGFEDADTVEVAPVDLRPDILSEGQPHYRLSLFASAQTALGYTKVTLLAGDDWGGAVDVVINAAGNNRVDVSMPFLPGDLNPQCVIALAQRAVTRGTWLYHRMVEQERALGQRV